MGRCWRDWIGEEAKSNGLNSRDLAEMGRSGAAPYNGWLPAVKRIDSSLRSE
jgi:hypothetical protein